MPLLKSRPFVDPAPVSPTTSAFLEDCLRGLAETQKSIPCKWLYDAEGSLIFEAICSTPEYYPTRTELKLLTVAAPEIAAQLSADTTLIEFGSGASQKTRLLLDAATAVTTYVPIDISAEELARASFLIAADYPALTLRPLHGDFTKPLQLESTDGARLGFFPGSTIGNFAPDESVDFLRSARTMLGAEARLLLGVDLIKDEETLVAAYDDSAGVTAAFNLNLLRRMCRELDSNIEPKAFRHRAVWNGAASRMEMHLVSQRDQIVRTGGKMIPFANGETIHTENSYKYDLDALAQMFWKSGWEIETRWISDAPAYALLLLKALGSASQHL